MALMKNHWYYLPVNPDPWAIGPLSVGRGKNGYFPRIGPNATLVAFKEEVRSHFPEPRTPVDHPVELEFFFWRRLEKWINDKGKTNTRNEADATNMQKACEDALQDVLIVNDRQVKSVTSHIMEQSEDTVGGIAVCIRAHVEAPEYMLSGEMLKARASHESKTSTHSDNSWPPTGGF